MIPPDKLYRYYFAIRFFVEFGFMLDLYSREPYEEAIGVLYQRDCAIEIEQRKRARTNDSTTQNH